MKRISFIIAILLCVKANAQTDSLAANRLRYFNQVLAGSLLGKSDLGSSLTLSTTHGVRFKIVSAGIGLGYDTYQEWRTMPIFASIMFDFVKFKNSSSLYLQFSGGYAQIWRAKIENDPFRYNSKGGMMIQPGIGYQIKAAQWRLYMSAGYKWQKFSYERTSPWWSWDGTVNRVSVEQETSRVSIQIGFGLN